MKNTKIGQKVEVINPLLRSNGFVGIIDSIVTRNTVRVRFNYLPWCLSPSPILTIRLENLTIIQTQEFETKNEVQIMNQIRNNEPFQVVKVQFLQGTNTHKQYSYAAYGEFKIDDTVVVKSAHNGFGLAKIVEIVENPTEADIAFVCEGREIVDKFTTEYYNKRVEFRKQVIADEQRKAELKRQMRKLAMEDNELVMFAKMAELNPTMKALLDEFNSIGTKSMADKNEN